MAKLYFRYGAMGAAKTLNLLAVAHNYRRQRKPVYLIKPLAAERDGDRITTRAGLSEAADFRPGPEDHIPELRRSDYECVLVDEAQFLAEHQVEELRSLATANGIPVICYGLRADYQLNAFPGSRRLFELADTIEEVKTTCAWCDRKATQNCRVRAEATEQASWYEPACFACFMQHHVEVSGVA